MDAVSGTIELNIATAAGTPPGVSGTGTVLVIQLNGIVSSETELTFRQENTELRDSINQTITVINLVGTVVRIR